MTFIHKYKHINLHYELWGQGEEAIICFHGFGRDRFDYEVLSTSFPDKRIFSFELPFHSFDASFKVEHIDQWRAFFLDFLNKEGVVKYDFWGYSLGGRFILSLLGGQVKAQKVFLLAPDGIKNNIWYVFASKTKIGRGLFKISVRQNQKLIPIVQRFEKWKLLNLKMSRFLIMNLESSARMERVFQVWTHLNALYPDLSTIHQTINDSCNKMVIVYGKKDPVIPYKPGLKLQKKTPNLEVLIVNRGHMLIMPSVFKMLIKRFYQI